MLQFIILSALLGGISDFVVLKVHSFIKPRREVEQECRKAPFIEEETDQSVLGHSISLLGHISHNPFPSQQSWGAHFGLAQYLLLSSLSTSHSLL